MPTLLGLLAPLCLLQSVEYRSPAGVEYRSQRDTGAIARAESALGADPRNVDKIIALGVAQSGVRQYREAIATFTRGVGIAPNNALLYRWRGHRYLSTRQFDKAMDDLQRGARLDTTIYGIWYHLGIVRFVRRDFAGAVQAFTHALPMSPDSAARAAKPRPRRCSIATPMCRTRATRTRSGCASIAARFLPIPCSRPPTPAT